MTFLMLCFLLLVAHAICDFPLQGETVAINKNPNAHTELQKHVPWIYWNLAHALMHGGAVAVLTGSVALGVLETIAHFWIDYGKSMKLYSIHVDQILHLVCKIVWAVCWLTLLQ